jgi:hypothetical protein
MKLLRKEIRMKQNYEKIRISPYVWALILIWDIFGMKAEAQNKIPDSTFRKISHQIKAFGKVEGFIKDVHGMAVPGATLSLVLLQDTHSISSNSSYSQTLSDEKGYFLFEATTGKFLIKATYIGYNPLQTAAFEIQSGKTLSLPPLVLSEKSTTLKEVSITAKKPFIERKVDKTVLNIEADILATGENALEVLKKAPGVSLDKDDHISLQGKQGVTIMLDGKLTYLSIDALTNLLKNTPASSIETIEIITQPSAKYDASGNSGIINIKTKKLKKAGLNGIITSGFGHGIFPRLNESLNLNFKKGNWNIFGNYDYNWDKNENHMFINRYFTTTGEQALFSSEDHIINNYQNHNYKVGIDYSLTKNQTLGVQVNGYSYFGNSPTTNNTQIESLQGVLDSTLEAVSANMNRGKGMTYNLNYKNTIDTLGQEISASLDYSNYNNLSTTQLTNSFYQIHEPGTSVIGPGAIPSSSNSIQTQSPSKGDIRVGKADYTLPINKTTKLDLGIKYSWVKTDNTIDYDSLRNGTYMPAITQSNHFIYTEKVGAIYGSFNKQWKTTGLVLGLRLEDTHSDGNSITLNDEVKRSYLDFFPNLSISQKLDSNNQFGLSYSRRIDRPSYQDLNPFRFYLDQYTYQEGNPFLKPQYTESFEISNTYKKSTFISFNFSWTKDVSTQVILQNDTTKVSKVTAENLNNLYSFSLTYSRPFHPFSWWTLNLNLNTNYNKFTSNSASVLGSLQASRISGSFNMTNSISLPDNWTAEFNAFYNAPAVYGFLEAKSQYAINAGIQKSFLNKKANVKVGLDDIFKTNNFRGSEIHDNVNLNVINYRDSRHLNISFTYGFGTNPQKHDKNTASVDEQNRNKH